MAGRGSLVIAFGNTLRCDDGAGAVVAGQLAAAVPDAHIVVVPQLLPELAEAAAHADVVVFIDATVEGAHGAVITRRVQPDVGPPPASGHHLTPGRLMALARTLFDGCPVSYLVSIGGAQFGFGTALSAEVSAAVPTAVRTVAALIELPGAASKPPAGH